MGGLQIIETLKATGAESDFFARWAGHHAKMLNSEQKLEVASQLLSTVPPFLSAINTAVILFVGSHRVLDAKLTLGMLVAFQSLMSSFMEPVNRLVAFGATLQQVSGDVSRLDDVLNFIPARLTALLLVLAAVITKRDGRNAWQTALHEHERTESPNAGWPMAAMSGALNVRLEKVGHYQLGKENAGLRPETVDTSVKLFLIAAMVWVLICFIVGVIHFVITT